MSQKQNLNIGVLSIAGSAGKSTFSRHGLAPLLPNSALISVEDWNAGDGRPDLEIGAKAFYSLAEQINIDDEQSFIVDIGTSNSKQMLQHFHDLELTRDRIDFWVVPVRAGAKERLDTLKTISMLQAMGVDPKTIIVIGQAVTDVTQFDSEFGPLKDAARQFGFFFAHQAVLFNEVFNMLKGGDQSVFDIVRDKPDFQALRREQKGDEKRLLELGNQMLVYSLCQTAARNLRSVFECTPMATALSSEVV